MKIGQHQNGLVVMASVVLLLRSVYIYIYMYLRV